MSRISLISCVSLKGTAPVPAAHLYQSALFLKTRAYAVTTSNYWFILSAEYGLLHPNTVIAPYDRTLNLMKTSERQAWSARVIEQMQERLPPADEVILLAGQRYRENIIDWLSKRYSRVAVPMEGLTIGRQLQWLKAAGF